MIKDFYLTKFSLDDFFQEIQKELLEDPAVIVNTKSPHIGKWSMTRLWRSWMGTTAEHMAKKGITMPLMTLPDGTPFGTRPFKPDDAHELFTIKWLGVDADGNRLSWSRSGREGMKPANKGERLHAMNRHDAWCAERGIMLIHPNDSEYTQLTEEHG